MCIETPPSAQRSFELHNDDAVVNYDGINKRKCLLQPRSFSASPKKNEFTLLVHEEPPVVLRVVLGSSCTLSNECGECKSLSRKKIASSECTGTKFCPCDPWK